MDADLRWSRIREFRWQAPACAVLASRVWAEMGLSQRTYDFQVLATTAELGIQTYGSRDLMGPRVAPMAGGIGILPLTMQLQPQASRQPLSDFQAKCRAHGASGQFSTPAPSACGASIRRETALGGSEAPTRRLWGLVCAPTAGGRPVESTRSVTISRRVDGRPVHCSVVMLLTCTMPDFLEKQKGHPNPLIIPDSEESGSL